MKMETIDYIFDKMESFYKERWTNIFLRTDHISSEIKTQNFKIMWQSALYGCTKEDLKKALIFYQNRAINKQTMPPSCIEFYNYSKSKPWMSRLYAR